MAGELWHCFKNLGWKGVKLFPIRFIQALLQKLIYLD